MREMNVLNADGDVRGEGRFLCQEYLPFFEVVLDIRS